MLISHSLVVHLGPNLPAMDGLPPSGGDGLQDNARCLRCDLSGWTASRWLKVEDILDAINKNPTAAQFHRTMLGRFEEGFLGIHSSAHFTIGGDADVSPQSRTLCE